MTISLDYFDGREGGDSDAAAAAALHVGGLAAGHEAARIGNSRGHLAHALLRIAAGDLLQAPQRRPAHCGIGTPERQEEDGRLRQGPQGAIPGEGVILR